MSSTVKALHRRTRRTGDDGAPESLKDFARRLSQGSGRSASAAGRWLANKLRRRGGERGGGSPAPPAAHSHGTRNGAKRKG